MKHRTNKVDNKMLVYYQITIKIKVPDLINHTLFVIMYYFIGCF